MDAEDVFRKLTRGAKFTKKRKETTIAAKKENAVKIKSEPIAADVDSFENANNLVDYGTKGASDHPITILGEITSTQLGKRGKKRKAKTEIDEDKKRQLLTQEKVNQYRNEHNINVVGRHVAEPAKIFEELQIAPDLIDNLKKCGYTEPTPIQKQAIPVMVDGRQVLACAPTGSGKTAAFLIPIIHGLKGPRKDGVRALVICPTRELAKQTQSECARLADGRNLKVHVITKIKQALARSFKSDVLITTPNRLCFLLKQEPPAISLAKVEWVVVDEADKLFEEGTRGFKDQLTDILEACSSEKKKIGMFSATYAPMVAKWCVHNMKGLVRIMIGHRNATTDLVEQELLFVGNESGKLLAFRDLIRKGLQPPVLVFVQSKERAQQLFSELIYDGINVDAIHADRTQLQRDNTVRSFREGRIWVLICTELMARGVDFKGVNLVINYDFPPSAIAYVHRVGRAGRAGRKGRAITYFTLEDTVNLRSIAHILRQSGCEVPDYMLYMKKHNRKERKQLEASAPDREDILTVPHDERRRIDRAKGVSRLKIVKKKRKGSEEKKRTGGEEKKSKGGEEKKSKGGEEKKSKGGEEKKCKGGEQKKSPELKRKKMLKIKENGKTGGKSKKLAALKSTNSKKKTLGFKTKRNLKMPTHKKTKTKQNRPKKL